MGTVNTDPKKSKSSKIIYYKIAATVIKSIDTDGRCHEIDHPPMPDHPPFANSAK